MDRNARRFPPPTQIMEDLWAGWRVQTLVAAVQLDVFTQIASGQRTAEQIAGALGVSPPALERLLNALVALRYLKKRERDYELEPIAQRYLVRGQEFYVEGIAAFVRMMSEQWPHLAEVISSGRPVRRIDKEEKAGEIFPVLVRFLFPFTFAVATAAAAALPATVRNRIGRILDVAAGAAPWAIAFAKTIPAARATVLDFPEVIPIARAYAERFGVADRFDYLEGNMRSVEFGRGRYDLVTLGQIVHGEGEQWGRRLLEKAFDALAEKGILALGEIIPNNQRTGPTAPLLFGLNMLLSSEEGNVFTMAEYRRWLSDAGFSRIRAVRVPPPFAVILAFKEKA